MTTIGLVMIVRNEATSTAIAAGKENIDENDRISYDCKK